MNQPDEGQLTEEPRGQAPPSAVCPPFAPLRLERQLVIDGAARWVALGIFVFCMLVAGVAEDATWLVLLVTLVAGLWVATGMVSARAAQKLPQISAMLAYDRAGAETTLAQTLRRWPMQRSVRLLLYHRLAALRHAQSQYAEAAAICDAVLSKRMGQAQHVRPHLLLILAESRLSGSDLMGTYRALVELHRSRLNLMEVLQLLAVQMRYEIAAGHAKSAVYRIDRKIQLVELMPVPQCGAVHAMLAAAAQRAQQVELAQWLRHRAELLCDPIELEAYLSKNLIPFGMTS